MLEPLQQWICDVCGETITSAEEGYVVWRHEKDQKDFGFQIIHQSKCDDNSAQSSLPLSSLIGDRGLSRLLAILSYGPLITEKHGPTKSRIASMDEFVDLLRRLHVSYYEEARQYFGDHKLQEDLEDSNEAYPYSPEKLFEIAKHKGGSP